MMSLWVNINVSWPLRFTTWQTVIFSRWRDNIHWNYGMSCWCVRLM